MWALVMAVTQLVTPGPAVACATPTCPGSAASARAVYCATFITHGSDLLAALDEEAGNEVDNGAAGVAEHDERSMG
jgi:hypothetical protein